jgi:dolichol-phosphate mannosyltransferase
MIRGEVIDGVSLTPIGWKILIEVLVKGNYQQVVEIPYQFHARTAGESKMSLREQWNYVRHVFRLVKNSPADRRLYVFALVGLSGVVVNMALYAVLVRWGIRVPIAGTLSAMTALVSNYTLNDRITWADANHDASLVRMAKYAVTSLVGIAVDVAVLNVLYGLGVSVFAANFFGIVVATAWNFVVNNGWVWKKKQNVQPVVVSQPVNTANSLQGVGTK